MAAFALIALVAWVCSWVARPGSTRVRAGLQIAGKAFTVTALLALGAFLLDLWLRKLAEAVTGVVVCLLMAVSRGFDERRRQDSAAAQSVGATRVEDTGAGRGVVCRGFGRPLNGPDRVT